MKIKQDHSSVNIRGKLPLLMKYKKEIYLLWKLYRNEYACLLFRCPKFTCCECPQLFDCLNKKRKCKGDLCFKTVLHLKQVITQNFLLTLPVKERISFMDLLSTCLISREFSGTR